MSAGLHYGGCRKGLCSCPNHRAERTTSLADRNRQRQEAANKLRRQFEEKRARPKQDTEA